MILLCQGAGGLWTGLGGATPDWWAGSYSPGFGGDRAPVTRSAKMWWVGSTGHYEDSISDASAGLLGQTPLPKMSGHVG